MSFLHKHLPIQNTYMNHKTVYIYGIGQCFFKFCRTISLFGKNPSLTPSIGLCKQDLKKIQLSRIHIQNRNLISSETEFDIQYKKLCIQLASRVAKTVKNQDFKKYRKIAKITKLHWERTQYPVYPAEISFLYWHSKNALLMDIYSVFSPNTGKQGPEKTPYLDTCHAVQILSVLSTFASFLNIFQNVLHRRACENKL